jgi:DNA-binding LytR/AlgR family response regulator
MSVNTSMDSLKSLSNEWPQRIRRYFAGNLGDFYSQAVNRLTLYPVIFTFFLAECSTFWLIYLGKSFFLNYMSFVMIYSLHKAAVYSLCIFAADTTVHYLVPHWGTFEKRSVGKQWFIWTMGLLVGFIIQRTTVNSLIIHYAPEVISYFIARPEARLSNLKLLLYLTPYWCFVMFVTIQIARSKQRIQDQARSLMILPGNQKNASTESLMVGEPEKRNNRLPEGNLNWENESGGVSIPLADITHITVEDHYCRINYSISNGLKNTMIRLPLKEMLLKLPQDHFIKIHRSHVVNIIHVLRLKKEGRDNKVVIRNTGVELPVSRSRFKDISPRLSR